MMSETTTKKKIGVNNMETRIEILNRERKQTEARMYLIGQQITDLKRQYDEYGYALESYDIEILREKKNNQPSIIIGS